MSTKLFQSVLFIVLCLAFGISEANVIVVDTNNTYKNVGAESNIDVTNYEKCTLANGKEIYTLKQNTSSKIMNAEEAELVNVTFLCSYDGTSMMPGELITVNGDNLPPKDAVITVVECRHHRPAGANNPRGALCQLSQD